jgi:hypothetical protein
MCLYVCLSSTQKMECNSIYNFSVYTVAFHFFCVESILPNHVTIVYVVGKSYFRHQTTHHHHRKFMISTCPFEKKLIHNFEVFPFKTWYHITLNLLYNVSCILFFKSDFVFFCNKSWSTILHIIVFKLYFFASWINLSTYP